MITPIYMRIVAAAAVLSSGVVFVVRTAYQPQYTSLDFAVLYAASQAWMAGENPYDESAAPRWWQAAGGRSDVIHADVGRDFGIEWIPILLIPPALPLLVPFALLPAPLATAMWWTFAGAMFVALWLGLASLMGAKPNSTEALVLFAASLVLAPVHECFGYGQPSLPSIGFIILGIWSVVHRYEARAGVLLALATALKPQLGGVFVIYYLLCGRWRMVAAWAAVMIVLSTIAIVPMMAQGTPWLSTWLSNLVAAEAPGGINSASPEYPARAHLLNLQVILLGLTDHRLVVNVLAIVITGGLAALFAWQRRHARQDDELLSVSIVAVLALMPMYHRMYDAALMMIPLAWAIANMRRRPGAALPVLLFVATFVLPDRALARFVEFFGREAASLSGPLWNLLIEPYRVWLMLVGYFLLLGAMRVDAPQERLLAGGPGIQPSLSH